MNDNYITCQEENGSINISEEVISSMVRTAISETEGVAGLANTAGACRADRAEDRVQGRKDPVCGQPDRCGRHHHRQLRLQYCQGGPDRSGKGDECDLFHHGL